MAKNYFKAIRKSYITSTLLTTVMGNLLVFGKPIQQMSMNINLSEFNKIGFVSNTPKKIRSYEEEKNVPNKTFYAKEKLAVIGKSTITDRENIRDNFFTITLPATIELHHYKVMLSYDLYGLDQASQTTKSINDNSAFGGKLLSKNKKWTAVNEYIPVESLRQGKNEIYFTRAIDENYRYEVKNLRLKLIEKSSEEVVMNEKTLINYKGSVYVSGIAPGKIEEIEVEGNKIPLRHGFFEETIKNIPTHTKELQLNYTSPNGKQKSLYLPVKYKDFNAEINSSSAEGFQGHASVSFSFSELNKKEQNFHSVTIAPFDKDEESQGIITLDGLGFKDLKYVSNDLTNVTQGDYLGYRIKKRGNNKKSPLKLHLKYDPAKIPTGYSLKDIKTFFFDHQQRQWKALPTDSLDYAHNEIITTINQETDYINGVIKVPENPETASFVPTAMNDIEYANPAAGVVSIPPPSANSMGTVNTSFPIKLPKGRNGMQPSLQLSYNSEAGNGWLGMGWNLNTPAITLNTKWGVPTFDPTYESEVYSLNGEDLVVKNGGEYTAPHRTSGITRGSGSKQFYLRKEGGEYLTITRKGSGTTNYYWVVEDKYGNKSYYGGDENGVENNAVLRSGDNGSGNIVHWALLRQEDPYGNYVQYYYTQANKTINGITGREFHLSRIEYTKHANGSGFYMVQFDNEENRDDAITSARNGRMQITSKLLSTIKVLLHSGSSTELIREYNLLYTPSSFGKSLLTDIEEKDTNGNLFYNNTIEYYDEIANSTIVSSSSENWSGQSDGVSSFLSVIAPGAIDNVLTGSALGTSDADGFSIAGRIYAGLGYNPTSVNTTVGVSGNYSRSSQDTRMSFIDINGDGLPDKVISNGNWVKYRYNTGDGFGQLISIDGISKLGKTISTTTGWSGDANALGLIGVGRSGSETLSNTDNYFIDYNGDGLPDMASGNRIRFNTTQDNSDYRMRAFGAADVQDSENPISSDVIDNDALQDIELDDLDDLRAKHSQFDHVTVWRAPYDGKVSITGNARLLELNDCDNMNANNEFRVTIERDDVGGEINATVVKTGYLITEGNEVSMSKDQLVKQGQYLFFRIHNEEYGCGGEVQWNPNIKYVQASSTDYLTGNQFIGKYDENNKKLWRFDAKEDFIINNGNSWQSSADGDVQLNFNLDQNFSANQFSDEIRFIIKKVKVNVTLNEDDQEIQTLQEVQRWTRTYSPGSGTITGDLTNTGYSGNVNATYNGGEKYYFICYAESNSNVDWNAINWKPIIKEENVDNYPSVSYKAYDTNINQVRYWFNQPLPQPYIDPNLTNDGATDFMRIEHTMFSQDYSDYLWVLGGEEVSPSPVKINWVVKSKTSTGIEILKDKTFYLYRTYYTQPDLSDLNGSWHYIFAEHGDNTGFFDPNNIDEDFYQLDLSKEKVEELRDNSAKIYSAFYIDNSRFGQANEAKVKLVLNTQETDENGDPYVFGDEDGEETLVSPFMASLLNFYGTGYRGWGQFLYNGGLKTNYAFSDEDGYTITGYSPLEGPIKIPDNATPPDDEGGVTDLEDQANQEEPDNEGNELDNTIYYMFYKQDNENNRYVNQSIKDAIFGLDGDENLVATTGRFAEKNLYDLWISPEDLISGDDEGGGIFIGLKQNSKSKGTATSGTLGFGSGTESKSYTDVLNQYVDVNGDRYPDFITKNNIQYSRMTGGLGEMTRSNDFTSGNKGEDRTEGVTISGIPANSTESSNQKSSDNQTRTNINSGINTSYGETFESKQWIDINGDGLTDKIRITKDGEIKVKLNLGYSFSQNWLSWASGYGSDFYTSTRSNGSVGLSGGGSNSNTYDNGNSVTSSYGGGFGASESNAHVQTTLLDVNGDGLPDLVRKLGNVYKYNYNTGTGFTSSNPKTFYGGNTIDQDKSIAGNIFGSYTYGVSIPLGFLPLAFKFGGTATAGGNASFSESTVSLGDINGDGFIDVLHKNDGNASVNANLNKTGKTHLLKKVNTPLGGSWTVDYEREGNTYDMPQSKWVMSKLTINDGFTGDNNFDPLETRMTYAYENGKYDRRDRSFYGFEKVRTNQLDENDNLFRYSENSYHNQNYYLKGMLKEQATYNKNNALLAKTRNFYNVLNPDNVPSTLQSNVDLNEPYIQPGTGNLDRTRLFPVMVKSISTTYENEGSQALNSVKEFTQYDSYGNLTEYIDHGTGDQDTYRTTIAYGNSSFHGLPTNIQVKDFNDNILREREASYNINGKLEQITVHLNSNQTNRIRYTYDGYGNTKYIEHLGATASDPAFVYIIEYDTTVHTYPVAFTDSFNQSSSVDEYSFKFGIPLRTTDMNGNQMRTRIDDRGRVVEVTAPNEMESGAFSNWTLRNIYEGENETALNNLGANEYVVDAEGYYLSNDPNNPGQHYAVTHHAVQQAQSGEVLTISIVDGLGQAIQVKKQHYALIGSSTSPQLKWLVSGFEKKDALGRVTESYLPVTQTWNATATDYYSQSPGSFPTPTLMEYDDRDRKTKITYPDGAETEFEYNIQDNLLHTNITQKNTGSNQVANVNNQTMDTYTDIRGRQRKTVQNDQITTQFYYNPINELIRVRNTQGYDTKYTYDIGGRRIKEVHPDRGVTNFTYNKEGNIIQKETANLLNQGNASIEYTYNYNRLIKIEYPNRPENTVEYVYGKPTPDNYERNTVGRLMVQKDATGMQFFEYGKLGELTRNIRSVAVAGRTSYWFNTTWQYDSWNRIQEITYPDNEHVTYNYDLAGQLKSVKSDLEGVATDNIVNNIIYNEYAERRGILYGNGTNVQYSYDPLRRLKTLTQTFTNGSANYQVIKNYTYDPFSNVKKIETSNDAALGSQSTHGKLVGPMSHTYNYDEFNRLEHSEGFYIGPNDQTPDLLRQNYSLDMEYDVAHNITTKEQYHEQGGVPDLSSAIANPHLMDNTSYALKYEDYASGSYSVAGENYVQPHAPRTIVQYPIDNPNDPDDPRVNKQFIDYDANGNMLSIKQEITDPEDPLGHQEIILKENVWDEENRLRTVDLNPEAAEDKPEIAAYTYDASGERIVKYIPAKFETYYSAKNAGYTSRFEAMIYPSPLVSAKTTPIDQIDQTEMNATQYTKHYYIGSERISSAIGTLKGFGVLCDLINPDIIYDDILESGQSFIEEVDTKIAAAETAITTDVETFDKHLVLPNSIDTYILKNCRKEHENGNYDAYWYHPDHLGSSSYISNRDGEISQHMEYLPFGETLVEEHLNSYNSPYRFNAKELDEETGNYYYGARYYDPKWSIWLSVDPMAGKYPSLSPYIYVANNPIKYVDPNGEDIYLSFASPEARAAYEKIVNNALGGGHEISIDDDTGKVTLVATGNKVTLTAKQQAFYDVYSNIANDPKNHVRQQIINSNSVMIGSWKDGELDIEDIQQFDKAGNGGDSSSDMLLFETIEQWLKAKKGLKPGDEGAKEEDEKGNWIRVDHNEAHDEATIILNQVQGNTRQKNERQGLYRTFLESDGSKTKQKIQQKVNEKWIQPINVIKNF